MADADTTSTVRVATFNTYLRPPLVTSTGFANDDFKAARLPDIIEELHRFDIVGLQEVFSTGTWRQHELIEGAAARGFAYSLHTRDRPVLGGHGCIDGGLVLLSRFRITDQAEIYYAPPLGKHRDRYIDKGALWALLEIDAARGRYLHVVLTHTQASYVANPGREEACAQLRLDQLRRLRGFIDEHVPADQPVLLLGDLNVNGRASPSSGKTSSWEYNELVAILSEGDKFIPRDVLREAHDGVHPITFGDPREDVLSDPGDRGHNARLDYIFWMERPKEIIATPLKRRKIDADAAAATTTTTTTTTVVAIQPQPDITRTKVEEFAVVHPKPDGPRFLSDHFGVSTILKYSEGD